MKIAARFSVPPSSPPSTYWPSAQTKSPGQGATEENSIRSSLWACCTPEVFRCSRMTLAKSWGLPQSRPSLAVWSMSSSFSFDAEDAVGRAALHRERAGDPDGFPVFVGPVVEVLEVGLRGDRRVDLLLARDPRVPPLGVQIGRDWLPRIAGGVGNVFERVRAVEGLVDRAERPDPRGFGIGCLQLVPGLRGRLGPRIAGRARVLPLLPRLRPRELFNASRSGSRVSCHRSQISSISVLCAIDLRVTCGTRS